MSCKSGTLIFDQGTVNLEESSYTAPFETAKTIPLIPITIDGKTTNWLFDSGAQLTVIQRDRISGERFTVRGASNRTEENGSEVIAEMKLGSAIFESIFSMNAPMIGLKKQIPDFGGIIGRNLIEKLNWLFDYPAKEYTISKEPLCEEYYLIASNNEKGAPFTYLTIDDKEYKVILDFGSSSTLNIPDDSEMAKHIRTLTDFETNTRNRYTVGGDQTITELVGILPLVTIGEYQFTDVKTNINISSQPRVGMSFFKDFKICIDKDENSYKIK